MSNTQVHDKLVDIHATISFAEYLRESFRIIKKYFSRDIFTQKLDSLGINSRLSFQKMIVGKRRFSEERIGVLAKVFDLTYLERLQATKLLKNIAIPKESPSVEYIAAPKKVLSDPLHTIVLNLCGLKKP